MEKIVHVGYAKLTLENWATSSFLGVYQSLTFKKKTKTNAFTDKIINCKYDSIDDK